MKTAEYMKVLVSERQIRENAQYEDLVNYGLRYKVGETMENFRHREQMRKEELEEFVLNVTLEEQSRIDYSERHVPYEYVSFTRDLLGQGNKYYYGEYQGWSIGIVDGGFGDIFAPEGNEFQEKYELWKDLLTTTLYNLLPNEDFSLYIIGNGKEGRPLPIYYMEFFMKDNPDTDRGAELFLVWEMDQGNMRKTEVNSRLDRGLRMADYAHAYLKLFIYRLESDLEESDVNRLRIDRLRVANLKRKDEDWNDWLIEQHEAKSTDALVAVVLLITSLAASIAFDQSIISVFAGIIVAGIASEEWLAPQAVLMGAIARFFKNEALALRMYYRTNFSIGIRSLCITLLASAGELSNFYEALGEIKFLGYTIPGDDAVLILTTAINMVSLFPCALSYFYEGVRVRDLPKDKYLQPKLYISKQYPCLMKYLEKCSWPPTPYTKNVARIRLHWSRGGYANNIENFLSGTVFANFFNRICKSRRKKVEEIPEPIGEDRILAREESMQIEAGFDDTVRRATSDDMRSDVIVDLAAPGSPSSLVCFVLCLPAMSKIYHSFLMKNTFFFDQDVDFVTKIITVALLLVEVTLATIGGLIVIVCDVFGALLLGLARLMLRVFTYNFVREILYIAPYPLAAYTPADLVLIVFLLFYAPFASRVLGMNRMICRSKSMARWYRLPRMVKVRTGRQSNHCWRSGSYFNDQYYVAGDIVVMNPRWTMMGLVDTGETVNGDNKCVWTSRGRRYANPSLCY